MSTFLSLLALTGIALAYQDTSPLLAWSSFQSSAIDNLPTTASSSAAVLDAILTNNDICDLDAVILVQHSGIHASDLRTLPASSAVFKAVSSSASSRAYPYLTTAAKSIDTLAQSLTTQCGSKLVRYSLAEDDGVVVLDDQKKSVVVLDMPTLKQEGTQRGAAMDSQSAALSDELAQLASTFPSHLVIYAGLPIPSFQTPLEVRQLSNPPFHTTQNTTLANGGILKRYQLLTPGLITSLLVVFFVFLPVLYIGIGSLAAIQSPVKLDNFGMKTFDATQRKNQ